MLKLGKLHRDIEKLAAAGARDEADRRERRTRAAQALAAHAEKAEWLAQRAAEARTSWLIPGFLEPPDLAVDPPDPPPDHTVVATDGSQIYPDRHAAAACYVLNLGEVILHYGAEPSARLDSTPTLHWQEEQLYRGEVGERHAVGPEEVGIERAVREAERLLELAREVAKPVVALLDGTLIPWSWDRSGGDWRAARVDEYLGILAAFEEVDVPLGSYISRSGAGDVVNLVRIAECDQPRVNCDACGHLRALLEETAGRRGLTREETDRLPCGWPAGLRDAELFAQRLTPLQRSATFVTASRVYDQETRDPAHRAVFFYLCCQGEVARVEMPGWVGRRPEQLARLHAVVADQVRKGRGYPVALTEAHEQAVIRGADREAFRRVLERSLVRHRAPLAGSAKQRSKDQPGV